MSVVIETTIGDLTVDLFTEERPIACLNFMKLCKLKYYNYNLFHTVEQGFIAQTGDPTGVGDGGCSIWGVVENPAKRFFEAESLPKIYHSSAGLLSLVSAGKSLVGSQFFFTLGANLTSLDGIHCVIGEVVEGNETLRKLNEAIVDENFRPYQDIRITHTVILDDPFPDPRGFRVPSRSPSPTAGRLQNGRIAADEDIDDTDGKSLEEIHEILAEREAKARATILEIVGDLPDAEMAPPENVLFVCKLNPVTTDDDLEIIFSRFGKVKGCEVIRDKKSGDSLQYAFVEFEDQKSCEAAFFKMDNVLIDDRRIHVDFSQSVAKVKWRGKGRGVEGPSGRLDFNNLSENVGNRSGRVEKSTRNGNKERVRDDRSLMTSEERRAAREKRHREQAREHKKLSRSRSRSRSEDKKARYDRPRDYRRDERRVEKCGNELPTRRRTDLESTRDYNRDERRRSSRSRSRQRAGRKDERQRRSRSRSNERKRDEKQRGYRSRNTEREIEATPKRRSPEIHHSNRRSPNKPDQEPSSSRSKIRLIVKEDVFKTKKSTKKKKRKHDTSSSSSESETETSNESSSSSSETSSSSSDDRRRKKNRKLKKKKHKSKKSKKAKKHKK